MGRSTSKVNRIFSPIAPNLGHTLEPYLTHIFFAQRWDDRDVVTIADQLVARPPQHVYPCCANSPSTVK
ncbi:MAG: hypothetical protein R3C14_30825 [Caldilineaceae bacterium]